MTIVGRSDVVVAVMVEELDVVTVLVVNEIVVVVDCEEVVIVDCKSLIVRSITSMFPSAPSMMYCKDLTFSVRFVARPSGSVSKF